jgi:hypothetical protein
VLTCHRTDCRHEDLVSWSGERSKALAHALRDWLPLVLHYVEPWLSETDISAGERWGEAVAKELEACNFGIICVTHENIASPWVLFESGALAKSLQESRVIPLLLDHEFRDISGPLAQFQAKKVDESGIAEVVYSINKAASAPVPDSRAKQLLSALWPELEKAVQDIPEVSEAAKHTRSQPEVLEELVMSVRALDARFRELSEDSPRRGRRSRRFHPMMLDEFAHMIGEGPGDPAALLMVASLFRDDVPWLYEIGVEAYRAARSGSRDEAARALRRFRRAAEMVERGPFLFDEAGLNPKELHMIMREVGHMLDREVLGAENDIREPTTRAADSDDE